MEAVALVADLVALVFLIYWVVANDSDATEVPSKGFFGFLTTLGDRETGRKKKLTFQEKRLMAQGKLPPEE